MSVEQKFDELVSNIKFNANLNHQEGTGFYAVYCPVCGKTDKKTGGFKFETDKIIYNCFRGSCDGSCVYEVDSYVSKRFRRLMDAIHVKIPIELSLKKPTIAEQIKKELESELYTEHSYKSIKIYDDMVDLAGRTDANSIKWINHFQKRKVPLDGIQMVRDGDYRGLCFIPFHLNGKLIGGQYVTERGYVAHNGGNEHVMYVPTGYLSFEPVFVVEGAMDAKCFPNTVAVLRDRLTKEQAYFLRGKRVIFIPDRKGGNKFHDQFHQYKWELCVPPWEQKDLNEAVIRYGVPSVYRMIMDNLYNDKLKGETAFKLWKLND